MVGMLADIAPSARLILPRRILLKAEPAKEHGKFMHSGKHALYGNPPRWHKITADKPAPKGAPVAAHPEAAGKHEPAKHFTDEQWAALKLPDTNVNAPTYNKALDKLREWSEAGNVTAIVGAGFGTNTYGQKLAKVANHLLAMHGSPHKVEPGQKAGTHAAVQAAPAEPEAPNPADQTVPAFESYDDGLDWAKKRAKDLGLGWQQYTATDEYKQHVYPMLSKLYASYKADHTEQQTNAGKALQAEMAKLGLKPGDKVTWSQPGPFLSTVTMSGVLKLDGNGVPHVHLDHEIAVAKPGGKIGYTKKVRWQTYMKPAEPAAPAPVAKGPAAQWSDLTADKRAQMLTFVSPLYVNAYGKPTAKAKQLAALGWDALTPEVQEKLAPIIEKFAPAVSGQAPSTKGPSEPMPEKPAPEAKDVKDHAKTATIGGVSFEAVKVEKPSPHWRAKVAGGNLLPLTAATKGDLWQKLKAHHASVGDAAFAAEFAPAAEPAKPAAALEHAKGGAAATPAPAPADTGPKEGDTKPAADGGVLVLKNGRWVKQGGDAPADPAANTGPLTAQQLSNLQSIPWFKLKLPAENTNAKSHNAAVAKIEAMAFAGDTAGLQAFIDSKAGAKQTYAKKQALLAQTALAGLQQPGATAAVPVEPAPAPAAPISPIDGWKAAIAAGKVPTKEQAEAYDALVEDDADAGLEAFMDAANSLIPADKMNDEAFDEALQEAHAKVSELHEHALNGTMPAAPIPEPIGAAAPKPSGPAGVDLSDLGPAEKQMLYKLIGNNDLAGLEAASKYGAPPAYKKAAGEALAALKAAKPAAPAKVTASAKLYTNTIDGHNKFWAVSVHGSVMKTTYGKNGTKGQETVKQFPSEAAAKAAADKLKSEKQGKGYQFAGYTEHEHEAAPGAAAEQGPKEGDTKMGADGMLVLKDGHWHKVGKKLSLSALNSALAGYVVPTNTITAKAKKAALAGDVAMLQQAYQDLLAKGKPLPNTKKALEVIATAMQAPLVGAPEQQGKPAAPAGALPSMDDWEQIGPQKGSNPGGVFQDPGGQDWYVKWPDDAEAAKSEVLAAKLYALAGLSSQDCMLVSKGGKTAIATKWTTIKKAGSAAALAKVPGVLDGFAVDAWLGNWDVVGMSLDNLQVGPDGKAHRVDAGGSLEYRAQGEKKPFGHKVEEIDTLRDAAKNPHAAAVFGKIKQADLLASVAKVAAISDVAIRAMVNEFGPGDAAAKAKLAETLIARKKDLIAKFPKAAKPKKKPTFDPAKISAPPSFLNWGGTGKSGPSSKEFLNKANDDAVQAIFAAAKTGKLDAIKNLTAPVLDKDSGQVTGHKPVLEHPSQHVKGYAQQSINEINYQLNPPKRFRFDGGHPLHALNSAYPAHAGAKSSATAQKLGKFIVLGEPGLVKLEDVGLPAKITHAEGGGTLSTSTYAPAAKAAFHKMPATQKQAIQSYTGSSYHEMNGSLWSGNPSGAAKAAGEALKTLGHDIQPGTVLSRKISLHGDDLQKLLGAKGKVLQEPAIMSTSIRPSSWGGNVHLKLHVGPGVKGLWVGKGSSPNGGSVSKNGGEDEMILPPNTRLLVLSTKAGGSKDADGFGLHSSHVIECIVLPTQ